MFAKFCSAKTNSGLNLLDNFLLLVNIFSDLILFKQKTNSLQQYCLTTQNLLLVYFGTYVSIQLKVIYYFDHHFTNTFWNGSHVIPQ